MIPLALIILVGVSSAITDEVYGKDIQSSAESPTELMRLKLETGDQEDSSQLKTIRKDGEYEIGKIFSHLQINTGPRPWTITKPQEDHIVIHKHNSGHNGGHHASYHGYLPVKIPSDTEYVIKPQGSSFNTHAIDNHAAEPEIDDHNTPEYYNYGHNGYSHNSHNYGRPEVHYSNVNNPSVYGNHGPYGHSSKPHIDSNSHHGQHDENYYDGFKPHHSHGSGSHHEHNIHHSHKPHYLDNNHGENYHETKPYYPQYHSEYNFHHGSHDLYPNQHGEPYQTHNHFVNHQTYNGDKPHHGHYNNDNHGHEESTNYHSPHGHILHSVSKPNYQHDVHHSPHGHNPHLVNKPNYHHDVHHNPHGHYLHYPHGHYLHSEDKPHYQQYEHQNGHDHHQEISHKPSNIHSYEDKPNYQHDLHHNPHGHYIHSEDKPHYQQYEHQNGHDHNNHHQEISHKPSNIHSYESYPLNKPIHSPHYQTNHHKPSNVPAKYGHSSYPPNKNKPHIHGNTYKPHPNHVSVHVNKTKENPKYNLQYYSNERAQGQLNSSIDKGQVMEGLDVGALQTIPDAQNNKNDVQNTTGTQSGSNNSVEGAHNMNTSSFQVNNIVIKNNNSSSPKGNTNNDKDSVLTQSKENSTIQAGNIISNEKPQKANATQVSQIFLPNSNSQKNQSSLTIYYTANEDHQVKPSSLISNAPQKPIQVDDLYHPSLPANHESETQDNSNEQSLTASQSIHNYNNHGHGTYNNYYEVTESEHETHSTSNEDSTSHEDNSYVSIPLFKPYEDSNADYEQIAGTHVVNNQPEHSAPSYSTDNSAYNQNKPYHSIENENGHFHEQNLNTPLSHYDQDNMFHGNHEYHLQNHPQNGYESVDYSGGIDHQSTPHYQQGSHGVHAQHYPHGSHGPRDPSDEYSGSEQTHDSHGYIPYREHSHSYHPNNNNNCELSHDHGSNKHPTKAQRPYYVPHNNHHNFNVEPVNSHIHEAFKPPHSDHEPHFGVSGIFINNYHKRPTVPFLEDADGERDYKGLIKSNSQWSQGYEKSYEDFEAGRTFEKQDENSNNEQSESQVYEDIESGYGRFDNIDFEKETKTNNRPYIGDILKSPRTRRHRYAGLDSQRESDNLTSKRLTGSSPEKEDFHDRNMQYVSQNDDNSRRYGTGYPITYMINPLLYTDINRPHNTQHEYQQLHDQSLTLNGNHAHHHQHENNYVNYLQPGYQTNNHGYSVSNPFYHQLLGLQTLNFLGHHQNNEHPGHHGVLDHANINSETHHQTLNGIPVKYIYVPVLYNLKPSTHENLVSTIHNHYSNQHQTINSGHDHKYNGSNFHHANRIALSGMNKPITLSDHEDSLILKPTIEVLKPLTVAPSTAPTKNTEGSREGLPLIWKFLNSPQLMYLNTFSSNDEMIPSDDVKYQKREDTTNELMLENKKDAISSTPSIGFLLQRIIKQYASKCEVIWNKLLLPDHDSVNTITQSNGVRSYNKPVEVSTQESKIESESLNTDSVSKKDTITGHPNSLESICKELLQSALHSELEISEIEKGERWKSRTEGQFETSEEILSSALTESKSDSESSDFNSDEFESIDQLTQNDELKAIDLLTDNDEFESMDQFMENKKSNEDGLNDREKAQVTEDFNQDYHW